MNTNYSRYDLAYDFKLQNFSPESLEFLGVKIKCIDGALPNPEDLEARTIYTFIINDYIHSIYSYKNGIIFNPNTFDVSLDSYINIYKDKFEVNFTDQEKFIDFLGSIRSNSSMFQHIDDDNSIGWCLLIGFLDFRGYTVFDLIEFFNVSGEFKSLSFNKIHYLSIFMSYCCIIAGITGKITKGIISESDAFEAVKDCISINFEEFNNKEDR